MKINNLLEQLIADEHLTISQMQELMHACMRGDLTDAQFAAFLVLMRKKGETVDELTAAAKVMMEFAHCIDLGDDLIDIVGTGGDGKNTFNVSTISSFVAAAAGAHVAKHGGRSVSGRSGSADLLFQAEFELYLTDDQLAQCMQQCGISFLFAPHFHQAMQHARQVRQQLGIRTLFNILGPLVNPARVKKQVMGVFAKHWLEPLAKVLANLGRERALVIHSHDGMDEVSIAAITDVVEYHHGHFKHWSIDPKEHGCFHATLDAIIVDSPAESLALADEVFNGTRGPARDIVLLNAASALYCAELAESYAEAVRKAELAIDSGEAARRFTRLKELTRTLTGKSMNSILNRIAEHKKQEVEFAKKTTSLDSLIHREMQPIRDFIGGLQHKSPAIIAEIKKASPSKGLIRADFDVASIAKIYEEHGASCLSVLTDVHFFQGSPAYLSLAKAHSSLPVLRKDFIIDPYQIYESRALGADCILLIVAMLDDKQLQDYCQLAQTLKMAVLVESHTLEEFERALQLPTPLMGVNNRSLHSFVTDIKTSLELVQYLPPDKMLVTESGINTHEDIQLMQENGINIFLIGESLMRAPDIGAKLKEFMG